MYPDCGWAAAGVHAGNTRIVRGMQCYDTQIQAGHDVDLMWT